MTVPEMVYSSVRERQRGRGETCKKEKAQKKKHWETTVVETDSVRNGEKATTGENEIDKREG